MYEKLSKDENGHFYLQIEKQTRREVASQKMLKFKLKNYRL